MSPITPSATIAERSDSIAPSIAIVNATGRSDCIVEKILSPAGRAGKRHSGRPDGNV